MIGTCMVASTMGFSILYIVSFCFLSGIFFIIVFSSGATKEKTARGIVIIRLMNSNYLRSFPTNGRKEKSPFSECRWQSY